MHFGKILVVYAMHGIGKNFAAGNFVFAINYNAIIRYPHTHTRLPFEDRIRIFKVQRMCYSMCCSINVE